MSCLLAVTTDLSAAKHLRSQPSAGIRPPISSTTMSAPELRMSSKFSVQTTEEGTIFARSEVRLRSTLRLKMWVSSMPGSFDSASTRATELPTVPKPSSAIFTGAVEEADGDFVGFVRVFGLEVLRLDAMSVFDPIGLGAPCVEVLDRFAGQKAGHGNLTLVDRTLRPPDRGRSRRSRRRRRRRRSCHRRWRRSATSRAQPGTSGRVRSWCTPRSR